MTQKKTNPLPHSLLALLVLGLLPASASAAGGDELAPGDWSRWRGPNRTGISTESGWKVEGATESLWEASVGLGYSTVVVSGGRLYTMGYDEDAGLDVVFCMDAESGDILWDHAYPSAIWNQAHGGGTVNTPTLDGGKLYVLNREGSFFVLDAESGEVLQERHLVEELEVEPPTWGFAGSPLILDDMLVLNLGRIVALDKESGELLWDTPSYGHAYSTPTPFELDGEPRLAAFNSEGAVVLDRGTGEELFKHEWEVRNRVNASTPIVEDGRLFISSGMTSGCKMFQLSESGAEILWESKVLSTSMTGCVLYQGHLYGFDGSIFKCVDLEGNEVWRERGLGNGAFMIADGKLILVSAQGELVVAKADPAGYEELSRADVLEDGVYWTSPVLSNGLIFVRSSLGQLVCRDHRGV